MSPFLPEAIDTLRHVGIRKLSLSVFGYFLSVLIILTGWYVLSGLSQFTSERLKERRSLRSVRIYLTSNDIIDEVTFAQSVYPTFDTLILHDLSSSFPEIEEAYIVYNFFEKVYTPDSATVHAVNHVYCSDLTCVQDVLETDKSTSHSLGRIDHGYAYTDSAFYNRVVRIDYQQFSWKFHSPAQTRKAIV